MDRTDARIGTQVAGYLIESLIGRGGMGVVYLAHHLQLKRKAALKVLAPELAHDDRFRQRFIRESELAASLDHPNIVPIYDAGQADDLLYIAMRYVGGTDLKRLIEAEGPLDPARACSIVSQVAGALDAAHELGLIHRDVKAANILITADPSGAAVDRAYLTDFGLTKRASSLSGITGTGQMVGTVDYAAPEQFEGKPLTAQTDVYSLGCVLYECLTAEVPFARDQEAAVMFAHLREPPPRVSAHRSGVPARMDDVVARAMAKDPLDRFATCGELAQQAQRAVTEEAPERTTLGFEPRRGRGPRWRGPLAAAILAAVVAVVLIVALAGGGRKPRASPTNPPAPKPFSGLVRIDVKTGRVVAHVPVDLTTVPYQFESTIAYADGFVWLGPNGSFIYKVSPLTNSIVATITVPGAFGLVAVPGKVWTFPVPVGDVRYIDRIDPKTNAVVQRTMVQHASFTQYAAFGEGRLWALGSGILTRFDPRTNGVTSKAVQGEQVVVGSGFVWVLDSVSGTVRALDPQTEAIVKSISLPGNPRAMAVGFDHLWILDSHGTVTKIPVSGSGGTDSIEVGADPQDIVAAEGSVWVANSGDGTVSRIDPVSEQVTTIRVGRYPTHIFVEGGRAWVLVQSRAPI